MPYATLNQVNKTIVDSLDDPYNLYSYITPYNSYAQVENFYMKNDDDVEIKSGSFRESCCGRGIIEGYLPLGGTSTAKQLKLLENQQSLQQQIVKIHQEQGAEALQKSQDKKDKMQKLLLARELQKRTNEVVSKVIDTQISDLETY